MDNIKDVLENVLGDLQKKNKKKTLDQLFEKVLTSQEKKHCQVQQIKDQLLIVVVDSPTWLYYFKTRKNNFLKNMGSKEIKDIRLK